MGQSPIFKVTIRNAKFSDIKQMKQINESSLQENYTMEFWTSTFNESHEHSFVAICGGQVIGYVLGTSDSIASFAVAEKFRSKGIGKQLLNNCLNTYKSDVSLQVRITNEIAKKLYYSLGFKDDQVIENYYCNRTVDAIHMIRKYDPTQAPLIIETKLHINLTK